MIDIELEYRLRNAIHARVDTKRLLVDTRALWGNQLKTDPQDFSIELRKALICLDEAHYIIEKRVEQLKDEADKTYSTSAEVLTVLREQLGPLFNCESKDEIIQIRTPFMFPDRDIIDIYWQDTPSGQIISDLGEARGWLFINSGSLTTEQEQIYHEVFSSYGVERQNGTLFKRVDNDNLANSVFLLVQAITVVVNTLYVMYGNQ